MIDPSNDWSRQQRPFAPPSRITQQTGGDGTDQLPTFKSGEKTGASGLRSADDQVFANESEDCTLAEEVLAAPSSASVKSN